MHTVQFAQDQNRLLFCPDLLSMTSYPSNFSKSRGVIQLINEGKATAFTKNLYPEIFKKLDEHETILWNNEKGKSINKSEQLGLDGLL